MGVEGIFVGEEWGFGGICVGEGWGAEWVFVCERDGVLGYLCVR
jgi:hypothetical protein